MTTVKNLMEVLGRKRPEQEIAYMLWQASDIHWCALKLGYILTDNEASEILDSVHRRADASIGINWTVIETHIEQTLPGNRKHHDPKCLERHLIYRREEAEFADKFPNYCRTCGGWGVHHYTENGAPHGAGYWPMPMTEPCTDCVEVDKCPLCGQHSLDDDGEKCNNCEWTWEGDYGGLSEPPDCMCWYERERRLAASRPAGLLPSDDD